MPHVQLFDLVRAARQGDAHAIKAGSEMAVAILKTDSRYTKEPEVVRDACEAIAISHKNGFDCENNVLVPCLTNKVNRNWAVRGAYSATVSKDAMYEIPPCANTSCPNHPQYEVFAEPVLASPFGNGFVLPDEYIPVKDR